MGDAHRAFGLVDVLAAGAGRAIDVDAHLLVGNVDLDGLVDHRIDRHGGKAGVPPRIGIEGRDAHQPVYARLALQPAIGVGALDQNRRRLDAGALAFAFFQIIDLVALLLGPAHVHAQQHLGPVLALGAARARMDFQIGVVGVRLARQHRLQPQSVGAFGQRGDGLLGLRDHRRVVLGLGHFGQTLRVGQLGLYFAHRRKPFLQPLTLAHQLLGFLRIVPDGGVFGLGVQLVEAADGLVPVKDASSAGRWPAGCRQYCVRLPGALGVSLGSRDIEIRGRAGKSADGPGPLPLGKK